jgi:hypothetical protein
MMGVPKKRTERTADAIVLPTIEKEAQPKEQQRTQRNGMRTMELSQLMAVPNLRLTGLRIPTEF